ncbi:MAG: hypothetical protein COA42_11200 [Alteromonadaceae bacterium]|nr:MAG: hypothetical protein COA42_11200 [Alteromonadaceae bacterium]
MLRHAPRAAFDTGSFADCPRQTKVIARHTANNDLAGINSLFSNACRRLLRSDPLTVALVAPWRFSLFSDIAVISPVILGQNYCIR